jgi:hypothetical protein
MSRGDEAIVYDAADCRCQLRRVPGVKKACRSRPDRRESGPLVPSVPPIEADAPNVVWAIDFQFDSHHRREGHQDPSMIDEKETNFGPFVSVRDTPRIAAFCAPLRRDF